ncbi:MAG: hypothetical protein IJ253_07425 [Bacteroidaceae bacterium]|nr:hypothetical protein [Bacteroidaceae bacterium]
MCKTIKKNYQKPALQVVAIQAISMMAQSVNDVNGNASIRYGGRGSGAARSRQHDSWDDGE